MAGQLLQFQEIIRTLMSADNEVRSQGETQYAQIDEPTRLQYLIHYMISGEVVEFRIMAAVLCRRLLSNMDDITTVVPADVLNTCKTELLKLLSQEPDEQMRKKVCDSVAELAKRYLDDEGNNQWPDVLKFLYECCSSGEDKMKECALHIMIAFPGIFGGQQDTYLQVIKEMLVSCLVQGIPDKVRLLAARAACMFITECVDDSKFGFFADLLPGILVMIKISVDLAEDDSLLKSFLEVIELAPKLVKHQLDDTINLMLQITSNKDIDENWRHLALEALVTLSETAPQMLRQHGKEYIPKIINEMLSFMIDIEDDEEWSFQDNLEDTDVDSNPVTGESSLDRFTCGLGGKAVLPHIISTIPQMLQHEDWKYRHAALLAVSAIAEGCVKQMEPLLASVVDSILPFLEDPHPRVRHASCNALGQLATDFSILFQKKFHAKVMPGFLKLLLNDSAFPRVQAHAAAALVNFCEECPPKILSPYLDELVNVLENVLNSKIQELLQKGVKLVLEQILTTIATVADAAEVKFTTYYSRFMPNLKYIFQNAIGKDFRLLRGKAIECISLIGLAVGAQTFLPDASEVMQLLLKTQTEMEVMEADDPQISYMISAWARMCKIIGKDFVQYLSLVMPPVLKAAQIKPDVAVLDMDDPQNTALDEEEGWEFVSLSEQQKFGIKTAGLEDKSTACQMLVHYARELKDGFLDYAEEVVKIMVPLLKFYFHDTVRVTAAESLPHLLECAKFKGEDYLRQMWTYICPELLTSIEREPEEAVVPEMMESFAKCIEVLPIGLITDDYFNELAKILHDKLKMHMDKQVERLGKRKEEDYDEEVEEILEDEREVDSYILSKVSEIMHSLFKTHRELILPFFEHMLPDFDKLLEESQPASDRQWSICIFDDLLEFTGHSSIKYQQYFLKRMVSYIQDENAEVRQAAAYGCGVMAQFGGEDYAAVCAEIIPILSQVIAHNESRSKINISATENCISAVTKICIYNNSKVNVDEIIPVWLSWLPVTEDQMEAPHIYGYLCSLIEANHPIVLGPNNINIPLIISIICESLVAEVYESHLELANRVRAILLQVKSNETVWNTSVTSLSEAQKNALQSFMQVNV